MGTVIQTFGRSLVNGIKFYMSDKQYKTSNDSSNTYEAVEKEPSIGYTVNTTVFK